MLLVITDCFCMFVSVAVGVAVATVVAGVVAVFASTSCIAHGCYWPHYVGGYRNEGTHRSHWLSGMG